MVTTSVEVVLGVGQALDVPARLTMATANESVNVMATASISGATGVAFNLVAGSDLNFDTNNNDRPIGANRNTGRQSSTGSVDHRLSRAFRIPGRQPVEALVEAFNLFNQSTSCR